MSRARLTQTGRCIGGAIAIGHVLMLAVPAFASTVPPGTECSDAPSGGTCRNGVTASTDKRIAAGSAASGIAPVAAVITVGRAVDLSGQRPVYFRRSRMMDRSVTMALSSHGRPMEPVRLISGPSAGPSLATISIMPRPGAVPTGMPVYTRSMTSGFGMRRHPMTGAYRVHSGIDLAAPTGSAIFAASDGYVASAGWRGGYGIAVTLDHGGGMETRYAHMSRMNVNPGTRVKAGDVIGFVGSTGQSTGPHLHYEVRFQGRAINPAALLRGK